MHVREVIEVALDSEERSPALHRLGEALEAVRRPCSLVYDLLTGVIDFDQECGASNQTLISYGICDEVLAHRLHSYLPDVHSANTANTRQIDMGQP
eukprot:7884269-Pyramimonas_sp.AAC.4